VTNGAGRVLVYCHAGCGTSDVLEAIGLTSRDLFDDAEGPVGNGGIVAEYDYTDETGALLFQVVRMSPKSFRQRRPDGRGSWIWKLNGTRRVLYLLPAVIKAVNEGRRIWIVEGEKDVHALKAVGEVATCNPGGAGKWRSEYADGLKGANVTIVVDKDDAGRKHAAQVRGTLAAVDATVRMVEALTGKDAADHLGAGHGLEDFAPVDMPAPDGDWTEPIPIDSPTILNPDLLGDVPGRMARETAAATQTPTDLAVAVGLGVLAATVGGRVEVEVRTDWYEPTNLYVAPIALSGEGKSPVIRALARPLRDIERARIAGMRAQVEIQQAKHDRLVKRLHRLQETAAKTGDIADEVAADDLVVELANKSRPVHPRLLVDDVTPEALISLLAAHGSIAAISAEAGLFGILAGRYSGDHNLDAVLKAWSGEEIRVDRKGRPPEFVEHPALTLVLTPQPIAMAAVLADPIMRDRGLVGRFLYVAPDTLQGSRDTRSALLTEDMVNEWADLLWRIFGATSLPEATQNTQDPSGSRSSGGFEGSSPVIRISPEALEVWHQFRERLEPKLGPDGELFGISSWVSKLDGQVIRIAGLLHIADDPEHALDRPISPPVMTRAVLIGIDLISHAQVVFGPTGAGSSQLRRLLMWIQRCGLDQFSARAAYQALKTSAVPDMATFQPLLDRLEELGYIRRAAVETNPIGGRPSVQYDVNPRVIQ